MEEPGFIAEENSLSKKSLYERNTASFKVFEENHNYFASKVGEVSRLAYPAIIATVYVASGNQVPKVETWALYTPQIAAVMATFFAVLGATFDFLQFYVMAWISKSDMINFERKIKPNDKYYPPIYPSRFDWSWTLFRLKGLFILLSAISLAVYLFSLSLVKQELVTEKNKNRIENLPESKLENPSETESPATKTDMD